MNKSYLAEILDIDAKPDQLDSVKDLWRENSKTLGFFPEGAFLEYAYKRQILIALDQEGRVCGYILYRTSKQKVNITHLCINNTNRNDGVTYLLLARLKKETEGLKGIGLYCRRDYSVSALWPKLGFVPIGEKKGRGKDQETLTYWWHDYRSPDLFSEIIEKDIEEKIGVVIDANVFYDLDPKNNSNESIESKSLNADWFNGEVAVCITDEIFTEINRINDESERNYQRGRASSFNLLETSREHVTAILDELMKILKEPKKDQDHSDRRQLAHAISAGVDFFITRDDYILKCANDIYEKYGLNIKRPAEIILEVDYLYDEASYRPARLAGTLGIFRLVSKDEIDKLSSIFCLQKIGEKKNVLKKRLATILSQTDKNRVYVAEDKEGEAIAVIAVSSIHETETSILFARVKEGVLGATLARYLLLKLIRECSFKKSHTVTFSDDYIQPIFKSALKEEGFFEVNNKWKRVIINGPIHFNQLKDGSFSSVLGESFLKLIEKTEEGKEKYSACEIEELIWPGKIVDNDVPCYIVPIKPGWARGLFDEHLANQDLFGADLSLAIQNEGVYYYSVKGAKTSAPGRILWYVSQDKNIPGSAAIRACSVLKDVDIDIPKSLYKKYRRLGIYEWQDVLKSADNDCNNKLVAMHFTKTELFHEPISWRNLQKILDGLPINKSIVTATHIPIDVFMKIYNIGMNNHA